MIDHVAIQCSDLDVSAAFYDAVLAPLGGRRIMELDGYDGAFAHDPDGNNVEAVHHTMGAEGVGERANDRGR